MYSSLEKVIEVWQDIKDLNVCRGLNIKMRLCQMMIMIITALGMK